MEADREILSLLREIRDQQSELLTLFRGWRMASDQERRGIDSTRLLAKQEYDTLACEQVEAYKQWADENRKYRRDLRIQRWIAVGLVAFAVIALGVIVAVRGVDGRGPSSPGQVSGSVSEGRR